MVHMAVGMQLLGLSNLMLCAIVDLDFGSTQHQENVKTLLSANLSKTDCVIHRLYAGTCMDRIYATVTLINRATEMILVAVSSISCLFF